MAVSIESHVVDLKLNNANFEKNAENSISTIQKLKESIKFKGASDGLKEVSKHVKEVDTERLSSGIKRATTEFGFLQVAGLTAMTRISNALIDITKKISNLMIAPLNQIKTGGWARAANIDQAKFQLEGLGIKWRDIQEDLNYAVQDTAYGLDSAAKAASQLAASGVKIGDNMKKSLRGISGVAAMTNSEYDEIARIFATVAGNGRLMGDQLLQLGSRGLNVASELAKSFRVTESELRDMVSKGKIDFQTFANAMDDAFGQHAKDADKTFTGSLSNVRAALSRIGADFAAPFRDNMIPIFRALKARINDIKKSLAPVYDGFESFMRKVSFYSVHFLKSFYLPKAASNILDTFKHIYNLISSIINTFKKALRDIFPKTNDIFDKSFANRLFEVTESIKNFITTFTLNGEQISNIQSIFRGIFATIKIMKNAIGELLKALSPAIPILKKIGSLVLKAAAAIGEYIVKISEVIEAHSGFEKLFSPISTVFNFISNGFRGIVKIIKNILPYLKTAFKQVTGAFKEWASQFSGSDIIGGFSLGLLIKTLNTSITNIVGMVATLKKNAGGIIGSIKDLFSKPGSLLSQLEDSLKVGTLKELSKCIALLAGSLFVLSLIDPARLLAASIAIRQLFLELSVAMGTISKFNSGWSTVIFAPLMLSFSSGILILSGAMKVLSSINIQDLIKSIFSLHIIMKMLASMLEDLSKIGSDGKILSGKIFVLTGAVYVLSMALKKIAKLDVQNVMIATLALVVIMNRLMVLVRGIVVIDKARINGIGILSLATAILIISSAIKKISKLDMGAAILSTIMISVIMNELLKVVSMMNKLKKSQVNSLSLLALAISVKIIASVIKNIGELDYKSAIIGVSGLYGIFTILLDYIERLSEIDPLKALPSIYSLSFAIATISNVIILLGNAGQKNIYGILSTYAIVEIMLYMIDSLHNMEDLSSLKLAGLGGSLILLSAGLIAFTVPLKILSTIEFHGLILSIGAFATILYVLYKAAEKIKRSKLEITLFKLSASMLAFGAASALVGAGIFLFSISIVTLAASGATVLIFLKDFIHILLTALPEAALAGAMAIEKFLEYIIDAVPKLFGKFLKAINKVLRLLIEEISITGGLIIQLLVEFFITTLNEFDKHWPRLVDHILNSLIILMDSLANGISERSEELARAFWNLVASIIKTLLYFVKDFFKLGGEFLKSLGGGFFGAFGEMFVYIGEAISALLNAIDNPEEWNKVGESLGNAFIAGIEAAIMGFGGLLDTIFGQIEGVGHDIWSWAFGEESANKAFMNFGDAANISMLTDLTQQLKNDGTRASEILDILIKKYDELGIVVSQVGDELYTSTKDGVFFSSEKLHEVDQNLRSLGYVVKHGMIEIEEIAEESSANISDKVSDNITSGIDETKNTTVNKVKSVIEDVKTVIKSDANLSNIGEFMMESLTNGADSASTLPINKAEEIIDTVNDTLNGDLDTTYDNGELRINTFDSGMASAMSSAEENVEGFVDRINSRLAGALATITIFQELSTDGSIIPSLRPGQETRRRKVRYDTDYDISSNVGSRRGKDTNADGKTVYRGKLGFEEIDRLSESTLKANKLLTDTEEQAEKTGNALSSSGGLKGGVEKATDAFVEFQEAVHNAVKSGMNIFQEFNRNVKLSGKQLLDNMRSQVSGVKEWANNLQLLAKRGISQGLLEELARMGPQSFEQVHAFTQMTNEELTEANLLFAESVKLPDSIASQLGDSWLLAGEMINEGLALGLRDPSQPIGALSETSKALLASFNAAWGIASPSQVMVTEGAYMMEGLGVGLMLFYGVHVVPALFKIQTSLQRAFQIIGGIAMTSFANAIIQHGQKAINAAQTIAAEVAATIAAALEIASPSKLMIRYGRYIDEGLAIGISKYANMPISNAKSVALDAAQAINNAILMVSDILNSDEGLVLKPVLDLSGVIEDSKHLNELFNDPVLSTTGKRAINNQDQQKQEGGKSIINNFTQNNYSPKALSRLEIYRHTRNQLRSATSF